MWKDLMSVWQMSVSSNSSDEEPEITGKVEII